jgi:hypothetical protein
LISNRGDGFAVSDCGTLTVADPCRDFQTAADSDISVTLRGRAEEPGLHSDLHIADAADAKDSNRRIDLITRTLENGNVGDHAPAAGNLVVDPNVEDQLVVFYLIVIQLALGLLVGTAKWRKELNSRKPRLTVRRRKEH